MKFGQISNPETVDLFLPETPLKTVSFLENFEKTDFEVYVGCAKWNKTDLKGFYPKGVKDELHYYATQFNSIELNATFYSSPSKKQVEIWANKVPADFKFFPKIPQSISHYSRLLNTDDKLLSFIDAVVLFEEKLGCIFLQLHENFSTKEFEKLKDFIEKFPKNIPLAVEIRNENWFLDKQAYDDFFYFLRKHQVSSVIVDAAGRRDVLHMELTTDAAFIRFVGANHFSDYERLDQWIEVLKYWRSLGLNKLYFLSIKILKLNLRY